MVQSPSSTETSVWKIALIVGALAGGLALVNIITAIMLHSGDSNRLQVWLDELVANLALYGLSGFLTTRGRPSIGAGIGAGVLTGVVGVIVGLCINALGVLSGSKDFLYDFVDQFCSFTCPYISVTSALRLLIEQWAVLAMVVAVVGGTLFGAIGGLIGRAARKRA